MVAPLKPEQIKQALQRGTRAELDEFERLVSEQFTTDPSLATEAHRAQARVKLERLRELGKKLFG
ncbi:MAG: hypothetical protein JWR40_557 [Massilia sp.]|jgi:hypothetical protein|nr:hypothetical protein [Massilia sp.]MDB5951430.1 hypothetical protein [Massilia sp.]